MKLASIELVGFKSFAQRTVIKFPRGLTEIVGPNGSGKSNVVEAIRWALGEQSTKQLRSTKMTDVIFSGSASRQALDRARVTLCFDNRDHALGVRYDWLKVSRKLYRNGDSYYYLNGKECRLRDVQGLFMNSGIGSGSFSVISQGNVEQIFNSSPEDRRFIVETAAGIYRYKFQKRHAKQELSQTNDNLSRITDLTRELDRQLTSLRHQKQTAQHFIQVKRVFRRFSALRLSLKLDELKTSARRYSLTARKCRSRISRISRQVESLNRRANNVSRRTKRIGLKNDALQDHLLKVSQRLDRFNGRLKLRHQHLKFLRQQVQTDRARISRLRSGGVRLTNKLQYLNSLLVNQKRLVSNLVQSLGRKPVQPKAPDDHSTRQQLVKQRTLYLNLVRQITRVKSQIDNYAKNRTGLKQQLASTKQRLERTQLRTKRVQARTQRLTTAIHQLKQALVHQARRVSKFKRNVDRASDVLKSGLRRNNKITSGVRLNRARLRDLRHVMANHTNLYRGNRNLLNHAGSIKGVLGPVVKFLRVPNSYVRAVEMVLRSQLQQIVVEDTEVARRAIGYLTQHRLGRVTLLPANAVTPKWLDSGIVRKCSAVNGYVGAAVDLVRMPRSLRLVKAYLLGNVLVAHDLKAAVLISKACRHRYRVVTLAGEVVNAGGSISGGRGRYRYHGLLSQKAQVKKLVNLVGQGKRLLSGLRPRISVQRRRLVSLRSGLTRETQRWRQNQQELRLKRIKVHDYSIELKRERQSEISVQVAFRQLNSKLATRGLDQFKQREAQLQQRLKRCQRLIQELTARVNKFRQVQLRENHHHHQDREKLIKAKDQDRNLEHRRGVLSNQLAGCHRRATALVRQLKIMQRKIKATLRSGQPTRISNRDQYRITRIKRALVSNRQTISRLHRTAKDTDRQRESFRQREMKVQRRISRNQLKLREVTYQAEKIHQTRRLHGYSDLEVPKGLTAAQVARRLTALRQQLKSFGAVNVASLGQFKAVNHRYQFLRRQLNDLDSSKQRLLATMNQVNFNLRRRFKRTFDRINAAFKQTFTQIFQGGHARLKLTDPDHLLTTGIMIMAQPPGKRYRSMELLSGGERSLTAIALLFAVLRIKPVPFCILDEAESALDAINISRFAQYMKKLDRKTQFIVITHRKTTMLYADHLYGITMQDSGVSKVISVDLKKVKER